MYFNQIHVPIDSFQATLPGIPNITPSQIMCSLEFLIDNLLSSISVDHVCMAVVTSTGSRGGTYGSTLPKKSDSSSPSIDINC